jgi:NADH-quinone oxidoreductase subunit J
MEAHFLAAVQVIVYAGAIVVLFLFVIMLLGVDRAEDLNVEPFRIQRPLAVIIGLSLSGLVIAAVVRGRSTLGTMGDDSAPGDENIRALARNLFSDYVLAFELTSVLLIVAVVGTVVLTRRSRRPEVSQ